jgi:hypothetical protein
VIPSMQRGGAPPPRARPASKNQAATKQPNTADDSALVTVVITSPPIGRCRRLVLVVPRCPACSHCHIHRSADPHGGRRRTGSCGKSYQVVLARQAEAERVTIPPENTSIVNNALSLARRGWHVFALDHPSLLVCAGVRTAAHDPATCTERGKHPCGAWSRMATTDPAAQGLPPVITDPATLERVAAVLRLVALPEPALFSSRAHRRPAEQRHGHG